MVDGWIDCSNCSHRFGAWVESCPKCGVKNSLYKGRKGRAGNIRKAGIGGGIAIAAIFTFVMAIGSTFSSEDQVAMQIDRSQNDEASLLIPTTTFQDSNAIQEELYFLSSGFHTGKDYSFNFRLESPISGAISVKVTDSTSSVLYENSFPVSEADFNHIPPNTYEFQSTPFSIVKKGIGTGVAEIIVKAQDGRTGTRIVENVRIPNAQASDAGYISAASQRGARVTTIPLEAMLPARDDIGTELTISPYEKIVYETEYGGGLGNLTRFSGFEEAIRQGFRDDLAYYVTLIRFDSVDAAQSVYTSFTTDLYNRGGFMQYETEGVDATCFGKYKDLSFYERVTLYCVKSDIFFHTYGSEEYSVKFAQIVADKIG